MRCRAHWPTAARGPADRRATSYSGAHLPPRPRVAALLSWGPPDEQAAMRQLWPTSRHDHECIRSRCPPWAVSHCAPPADLCFAQTPTVNAPPPPLASVHSHHPGPFDVRRARHVGGGPPPLNAINLSLQPHLLRAPPTSTSDHRHLQLPPPPAFPWPTCSLRPTSRPPALFREFLLPALSRPAPRRNPGRRLDRKPSTDNGRAEHLSVAAAHVTPPLSSHRAGRQ